MASPRGVFHQVHVAGFKTMDRAVTQPYLPYAGNADNELRCGGLCQSMNCPGPNWLKTMLSVRMGAISSGCSSRG